MYFAAAEEFGHAGYIEFLPTFRCHIDGRQVRLPKALQELVASLVLRGGISRQSMGARLWPDSEPSVSSKRLRQLLWRLRRESGDRLLAVDGDYLCLHPTIEVDLRGAEQRISALLNDQSSGGRKTEPIQRDSWHFLGMPLLCGWTMEEVLEEQGRWDQVRSLALEALAGACQGAGDVVGVVQFTAAAMKIDNLNEVPYRLLASTYLDRGDEARAIGVHDGYADLLRSQSGTAPSPEFTQMFRSDVRPSRSSRVA